MKTVVIRGAGDLATGIGWKLQRCGFKVIMLEIEKPLAIRRTVSFAQAVYDGEITIEGIKGILVKRREDINSEWELGNIPILIDKDAKILETIDADILVDAILAKKNLGTNMDMAKKVIGIGPGFTAGKDVHLVVETKRGHYLGRIIENGSAIANTGVPGNIGGYAKERVVHSPIAGRITHLKKIGDVVEIGDHILKIENVPVKTQVPGVIRGLLQEGLDVKKGLKIADIDPRADKEHCFTISDKGRAIAGGVLEGVLLKRYFNS